MPTKMKTALGFTLVLSMAAMVGDAGATATAKTTLTVRGMTCGGCVAAVKLQLKRTDGVTAYEVGVEKGEAEVTYDPSRTDPKKIADSVSKTGFAASVKETSKKGASLTARAPVARDGRLDPWQPVEAAFTACSEGVCGRRGRSAHAVGQPGAQPGQYVYCPVSGAVFEVKQSSPRAEVGGKPVYLCCEACARYFAVSRESVLALRGLGE